ncbi:PH domain-containing protein [Micrococcus sp.]|uniref:PH domain-containing protein n=1 Tax=Micrococcus sp. TaxID=1271 RepID=UPI002A917CF3|nr:PH domain-containing protein [Micrococcus sp.]MDY6054841.1 PH domain-containing protein [Micrococcus sp.]
MRLEPGERVMVLARTRTRSLLGPAAVLVLVAFAVGLALGALARPGLPSVLAGVRPGLEAAVWIAAALAVAAGTLRPVLRWATGAVVVTDRCLVVRPGWGGGRDRARPLVHIADVRRRGRSSAGELVVVFGHADPQDPSRQEIWHLTGLPEPARFEDALAEVTRQAHAAAWSAPHPAGSAGAR